MITIEHTQIDGFEAACRGMRNPLNSWAKSDSNYDELLNEYNIGPADYDLMKRLVSSGTDHSKFMRMITVTCDITAPRYWWTEFDTYKIGTVRNSCSTMHTITKKPFELSDFSNEFLSEMTDDETMKEYEEDILPYIINTLNKYRDAFNKSAEKKFWWYKIIQLLPQSYNQKATVLLNYQVLKNMYHARKTHKLNEWHRFCEWVERLPHSELITM